MYRHALRAAALIAALALIPVAQAAKPSSPPAATLDGETLSASDVVAGRFVNESVSCAPDGSGTVRFTAFGVAAGPYPGTFVESGTIVLGPRPIASTLSPIVALEMSFTIFGANATITGNKGLLTTAAAAICVDSPSGDSFTASLPMAYTATIRTRAPRTIFRDEGTSTAELVAVGGTAPDDVLRAVRLGARRGGRAQAGKGLRRPEPRARPRAGMQEDAALMVDAARSPVSGRELVRLGCGGRPPAMLAASAGD